MSFGTIFFGIRIDLGQGWAYKAANRRLTPPIFDGRTMEPVLIFLL